MPATLAAMRVALMAWRPGRARGALLSVPAERGPGGEDRVTSGRV
jgi:hypothetical protein